jgi:Mn2+/Fe2+ NRAMP family transporter
MVTPLVRVTMTMALMMPTAAQQPGARNVYCQAEKLAEVMMLIIAIVGTTVAPWQLFFQQSYVVDKRITARFIKYERIDLWIGIAFVIVGAIAMTPSLPCS